MWSEKAKSIVENILSNVIASIILMAVTGFGASGAVVWCSVKALIMKSENNIIPPIYWVVYIVGLLVAMFCIILTVINIVKKARKPNVSKIQSDIRYERAISELYFKNREEIVCSREVEFEVLCERKDSITKQFMWTGTEYKGTVLEKSAGEYTLVDYQRKKPPHGYEVKFDDMKYRGDRVWYKTKTEVSDASHDMKPFFSHMVKSPTDSLEIRVTAPKGLLRDVVYVVCADALGEIQISVPKSIRAKCIGDLETFSYVIDNPNLLYCYRLEWKFL